MNRSWKPIPLGDLLTRSDKIVNIDPLKTYKQVTVRLWGKGVILRDEVSGSEISSAKRYEVKPGQFILSKIDARNGAFGLVPPDLDGAVVSGDFPAFNINPDRLEPKFLEWKSKTKEFVDLCRAASEGTTNRVRLKEDKFLRLSLSLPPFPEQRRIVAKIEALAAKIEEARRAKRDIEEKAREMMLSAFTDITKNAPLKKIGNVAPLIRRSVQIRKDEKYPELGIRSFGKGTFHKPALDYLTVGTKRLFRIEPGDLLFNNVFAWEGAIAVAQKDDEGRCGSHRFITCVPRKGTVTSEFLCFYLLSREGLEKIGEASPGGAGRNRTLALKKLAEIEVPIPIFGKQLWFDHLQYKVDTLLSLQIQTVAELDALLPAILDQAFKGEL